MTVTAAITCGAAHVCHGVLTWSGAALRGTPACPGCCCTGATYEQHCHDDVVSAMAMLLPHYDYVVAAAMAASVSQERLV